MEGPLGHPNRARSAHFDFWLVHTPPRGLHLGTGPEGLAPWPSRTVAEARRADSEARRAEEVTQLLQESQEREQESQEREAALRAELERLRGKSP